MQNDQLNSYISVTQRGPNEERFFDVTDVQFVF